MSDYKRYNPNFKSGIKTLEDVETIKKAGVDGFFVGSSLMKLLDDPIQLHRKITEFINAGK